MGEMLGEALNHERIANLNYSLKSKAKKLCL